MTSTRGDVERVAREMAVSQGEVGLLPYERRVYYMDLAKIAIRTLGR